MDAGLDARELLPLAGAVTDHGGLLPGNPSWLFLVRT